MAYTLQAIVTLADDIQNKITQPLRVLTLGANVKMVPLGDEVIRFYGIPFCPLTDGGGTDMPPQIQKLCEKLSQARTVAYIEAELFGGAGTQASIIFTDGKPVGQPIVSETAINQALHNLGVPKGNAFDEFEAVGLGAHRDTQAWLE